MDPRKPEWQSRSWEHESAQRESEDEAPSETTSDLGDSPERASLYSRDNANLMMQQGRDARALLGALGQHGDPSRPDTRFLDSSASTSEHMQASTGGVAPMLSRDYDPSVLYVGHAVSSGALRDQNPLLPSSLDPRFPSVERALPHVDHQTLQQALLRQQVLQQQNSARDVERSTSPTRVVDRSVLGVDRDPWNQQYRHGTFGTGIAPPPAGIQIAPQLQGHDLASLLLRGQSGTLPLQSLNPSLSSLPGLSSYLATARTQPILGSSLQGIQDELLHAQRAQLLEGARGVSDPSLGLRYGGVNPLQQSDALFPQHAQAASQVAAAAASNPIAAASIGAPSQETIPVERPTARTRPKRPLTAYNLFFRDERAKLLAEREHDSSSPEKGESKHTSEGTKRKRKSKPHGKIGFQEMAHIIGKRWKQIDSNLLAKYEAEAAKLKSKYKEELALYLEWEKEQLEAKRVALEATVPEDTKQRYFSSSKSP